MSPTVLAVSPHLDDAVLSAGATLAQLSLDGWDVEVCTVFAGVPTHPLSRVAQSFHADCSQGDDAIEHRRDEDAVAVAMLGAAARHWPFLDAVYRRRTASWWLCEHDLAMFDPVLPAEPDLTRVITARVEELLTPSTALVLTCATVGGHVDHRLTRDAVQAALRPAGPRCLLWEDLPYALGQPKLSEAPARMPPIRDHAWTLKYRAVASYASQLRMLWPAGRDWRGELDDHARVRGHGQRAETFFPAWPR